jgi:hypothetical protein
MAHLATFDDGRLQRVPHLATFDDGRLQRVPHLATFDDRRLQRIPHSAAPDGGRLQPMPHSVSFDDGVAGALLELDEALLDGQLQVLPDQGAVHVPLVVLGPDSRGSPWRLRLTTGLGPGSL